MAAAATKAVATAHEQFAELHADTAERLAALAHEWAAGEWSSGTWAGEMDAILLDAHTAAVVIGRQHAGDDAALEADDRAFAVPIVAEEHVYLQGFREALERGEFTGEDGTRDGDAVAARARMYSTRLVGTANTAWLLALPQETLITWHLGGSAETCVDCAELAEASPFTPDALPTVPGANETLCKQGCNCFLTTDTGQRGFVND